MGVLSFSYGLQLDVWSPRDEIAHYDYVDSVGDLRFPSTFDPITDYTLRLCSIPGWYESQSFDGSKKSMGLAGNSYEAQQPPLYYFLLAGPNLLLKALGVSGPTQIAVLRSLGTLFHLVGALLFVPLFAALAKGGHANCLRGLAFATLALATNVAEFTTLGNDSLSLFFGNAALLMAALYSLNSRRSFLATSVLLASFAIWAKWTNAGLVPAIVAFLFAKGRLSENKERLIVIVAATVPAASLVVFNYITHGSLMGAQSVLPKFASFVHAFPSENFLPVLATNAFNLQHVGIHTDYKWGLLIIGAVVARGFAAGTIWSRSKDQKRSLEFVFCAVSLAVLLSAHLLNLHVHGAHWHSFRHYYAYLPFLYFSIFGLGKRGDLTSKCLGVLVVLGAMVVALEAVE